MPLVTTRLATVYFFRKEMVAFRVEADRALALNPLDASAKAYLGLLIAAAGEWDRGCQMVESAMQLNPNCPGYFYFARCCNGYRQGRYEEVLEGAARVNMPELLPCASVDVRQPSVNSVAKKRRARRCMTCWRSVPISPSPHAASMPSGTTPELIEQIIDGLRKAGLEIPEDQKTPSSGAAAAATSQASALFPE